MPVTIDKLDISVHSSYALRQMLVEGVDAEWRLNQAQAVQSQVQMVTNIPTPEQLSLIFPTDIYPSVWAYFYAPKYYYSQRRSPFSFSRFLPTLGSSEDQEKLYDDIAETACSSPEEEKEKAILLRCFNQIDKINSMLSYIVGRLGQFLQG